MVDRVFDSFRDLLRFLYAMDGGKGARANSNNHVLCSHLACMALIGWVVSGEVQGGVFCLQQPRRKAVTEANRSCVYVEVEKALDSRPVG